LKVLKLKQNKIHQVYGISLKVGIATGYALDDQEEREFESR
jgi:hypothetical protein